MATGFFNVPMPVNEPVLSYAPGSPERAEIQQQLNALNGIVADIPMVIGGEEVRTEEVHTITPPHDHQRVVGRYYQGDELHIERAINAALGAKYDWEAMAWEQRAAIFLKMAELISGPYRAKINAATMIGQSKNVYQAEIDSACELADFFRFNVAYMTNIYKQQPASAKGMWNRLEYRPLEGFVYALTPFNFTAIAGNLPTAPAMLGNVVVWKPSQTQIYSAHILMEVFKEAGLPDGVINMVFVSGPMAADIVLSHPEFAGIHFTGSTGVFQSIWKKIGENISKYKSYPRIVGETGGKDFIIAHKSANAKQVATAIVRGAFEYQGQKCSAASRAYIPQNIWEEVKEHVVNDLKGVKIGAPEDFSNFMNAVIDEKAFDKITSYIEDAKKSPLIEVISGGGHDKSKGYFIEPTVLLTQDPKYTTMCEEIFGPVITIYVYHPEHFDEVLYLVDNTSPYALTGAVFASDRYAIEMATKELQHAAGNFYINDKPTGAVVNQQPFGGARASGTNDKAGSELNLLRWVSARTIKETFVPPVDYTYPFMK